MFSEVLISPFLVTVLACKLTALMENGIKLVEDNKMKFIKNSLFSLLLGMVGCGDTVNNFYDDSEKPRTHQTANNKCQSPYYGAHMWEIYHCRVGLHLSEDCRVGVADGAGSYVYDDRVTYLGLEITDVGSLHRFDPEMRFMVEGSRVSERHVKLNGLLDEFGGAVLKRVNPPPTSATDGCSPVHADDCVYVPLADAFPGSGGCMASSVYHKNR